MYSQECKQIMSNLLDSIRSQLHITDCRDYQFSRPGSNQKSDISNAHPEEFLLLTLHCQPELTETISKIKTAGFVLDYKILYNTNYPYTICTNPATRKISVFQKYLGVM